MLDIEVEKRYTARMCMNTSNRNSIHDCIEVEKAFVTLRNWIECWDAWCPCLRQGPRHKDDCSYLGFLAQVKELQEKSGIDPYHELWRENTFEIERKRRKDIDKQNSTPTVSN